MKIALIGTHSTGKTTLAYAVASELRKAGANAIVLTEIARNCPFPINEQRTLEGQLWILYTQLKEELEKERTCDVLISDRSVIDPWIYTITKFNRSRVEYLEPLVLKQARTYYLLFKTPIKPEYLKYDGFRSTSTEFQKLIDDEMTKFLKDNKIPHIVLPAEGTMQAILNYAKR